MASLLTLLLASVLQSGNDCLGVSRHSMSSNANLSSAEDLLVLFSFYCFVGVELLKQYKVEVDKFESDRQELANAEKLFDLPITMYQELIQVQKELKGLEQIYTIYQEQKVIIMF